jgi:hypothetical protein
MFELLRDQQAPGEGQDLSLGSSTSLGLSFLLGLTGFMGDHGRGSEQGTLSVCPWGGAEGLSRPRRPRPAPSLSLSLSLSPLDREHGLPAQPAPGDATWP